MCWLMVLPSGRWNGHCRVEDVKWLMLLPLGRCYSPGSIFISILVLGMLYRTSSHICGRWYLPTFLFRDDCWPWYKELLLCLSWGSGPPSHFVEVINTYAMTSGVKMVNYGRGGLLVFLEPLFKGPWGLSYIFFNHTPPYHIL